MLYDWECRHVLHRTDQDVGFWTEMARLGRGPVLELACGTGRLTGALAQAGVPIVGLDIDPVMLKAAKRRPRHLSVEPEYPGWPVYLAADMRRFALAGQFSLVFVGYNSLQLLAAPGDMGACLSVARQHLEEGGMIGVEVTEFQRGGADGPDDDGEGEPVPLADAEGVRLSGSLVHHFATRTSRYRRHFAGNGWAVENEVTVRSLDRPELEALFRRAGLSPVRWWSEGTTVRALATP